MQTQNVSTAATAASDLAPFTVFHFVLIVVLAILAVLVLIVGTRLARKRHATVAEVEERRAEVEQAAPVPTAPPAQTPAAAELSLSTTPVPEAPAARQEEGGDLTRLKGLGPRIAAKLNELGVMSIADLARLTPEAAAALDADLGPFAGRLSRDRWVEQARFLAASDTAGFEREFGKLG